MSPGVYGDLLISEGHYAYCHHCGKQLLKQHEWNYKPWFLARVIVSHMTRKHPNVVQITRMPVSRSRMYRMSQGRG